MGGDAVEVAMPGPAPARGGVLKGVLEGVRAGKEGISRR